MGGGGKESEKGSGLGRSARPGQSLHFFLLCAQTACPGYLQGCILTLEIIITNRLLMTELMKVLTLGFYIVIKAAVRPALNPGPSPEVIHRGGMQTHTCPTMPCKGNKRPRIHEELSGGHNFLLYRPDCSRERRLTPTPHPAQGGTRWRRSITVTEACRSAAASRTAVCPSVFAFGDDLAAEW
ncbi:unnamed protein product [Pleuronectes platessa]|uniref:Uncharacterized protein n=1 Tax=Pleuronectes platessa TaxID=8262 RepID=A0A9N7Y4P5_PLEPL|nr:unnamed protein product [Pleuronectes platessa]